MQGASVSCKQCARFVSARDCTASGHRLESKMHNSDVNFPSLRGSQRFCTLTTVDDVVYGPAPVFPIVPNMCIAGFRRWPAAGIIRSVFKAICANSDGLLEALYMFVLAQFAPALQPSPDHVMQLAMKLFATCCFRGIGSVLQSPTIWGSNSSRAQPNDVTCIRVRSITCQWLHDIVLS